MNERDLKLYSYLKSKGGGGSKEKPLKILDYQEVISGNGTSWTSKSFSLKAGDTLIFAIMHRDAITVAPQGFTLITSNQSMSWQRISIYAYTATDTETKTASFTLSNARRYDCYLWKMENASVSENANLKKGQSSKTNFSFTNEYRPMLIMFGCYNSGAWSLPSALKGQLVFPAAEYTTYAIDFNTAYSSTLTFTPPSDQWSTAGIYLTEVSQP